MFPLGESAFTTVLLFVLFAAPFVLLMRALGRLARVSYGFVEPEEDDGPVLRVCASCHNTVLEEDFAHCPYCGAPLPVVPKGSES